MSLHARTYISSIGRSTKAEFLKLLSTTYINHRMIKAENAESYKQKTLHFRTMYSENINGNLWALDGVLCFMTHNSGAKFLK